MVVERAGPGAYLFDTDGIDELLERDDPTEKDERRLEQEALEMVRSWDMGQLVDEASEEKDKILNVRGNIETTYYEGDKDFEDLKNDMDEILKNTLWIKKEVSNPEGKQIWASSIIQCDRIGYLEFNPIPFESTIHDGKPSITNMNEGLMPGLLQGILYLREGESAYLLIHPRMMYGPLGAPPSVPPDAYFLYYIRIYKVWDDSDLEEMRRYEREQHLVVSIEDKYELSLKHKDVAKQYLIDNNPREALLRYKAALKWIAESPEEEIERMPECKKLLGVLWQNTAITLNKLEMFKSASKAAKQALSIDPGNIKAIYQLARARIELGDHSRALTVLNYGKKLAPDNTSLRYLRSRVDVQLREEKAKRDEIMTKMSKACFL